MDKNKKFASNGFGVSGVLMFISGILMMASGRVAIGAVFWASANCMFLAARHFAKAAEEKDAEKKFWTDTESRCTVKVEEDLFSIGMESMNESRSESFQILRKEE